MTTKQIFWEEFKIGINSYKLAFKIIFENKLFVYFILPLLLNIALFSIGTKFIFDLIEITKTYFFNWVDFDNKQFFGHQYLNDIFKWLISIAIFIAFFVGYMLLSGQIIMIIMSPVFSLISEKVDNLTTGKDYPFEFKQLLKDVVRGTLISVRNTVIEFLVMIVMFAISFIPIIGFASPIVMFLLSSYYYGFSFMDYTNERKTMNLKQSVAYVKQHKGLAYSNGAVFSLILFIPFCGAFLSAFLSIISVVAATLSINQVEFKNKINAKN